MLTDINNAVGFIVLASAAWLERMQRRAATIDACHSCTAIDALASSLSNPYVEPAMRHLSSITLNQTPVQLSLDTTVKEACRQMHENELGAVLVIRNNGQIAGIFTGRDVVQRVVAQERDVSETTLETVMTPEPAIMAPDDSAIDALRLMWDGGFRHVPIARGNQVLGIVTRSDFNEAEERQLRDERELWEHMR